ncbi:MAG: hypothetical protein ACI9E5_000111 [Candidatus Omnitrophota bacterium]|jgi:hypothetical protein
MKWFYAALIIFMVPALGQAEEGVVSPKAKVFVYDGKEKQDPFMPLVTSTGIFVNFKKGYMVSDLVLEGVMMGSSGNIAIINGDIMKEKDRIGDFVVEKINADTVILLKETQRFTLRLTKGE